MTTDAKRSLGQNWLVNEGVADRIVQAAEVTRNDTVLEIGPGKGVLTERLSAVAGRLIAVEKDVRLIEPLHEQYAHNTTVRIEEGDALEVDPSLWGLTDDSYIVVANLPYYITSHVIRKLLSEWPRSSRAILMVQREVAKRMAAEPPDMSLLALSVQLYADVEKVMDVSRGSFRPSPDVDSTVVRLLPKALTPEERSVNEAALAVAKRAFGQKRKQLTATIDSGALERCGIQSSARPQELGSVAWKCLVATAQK